MIYHELWCRCITLYVLFHVVSLHKSTVVHNEVLLAPGMQLYVINIDASHRINVTRHLIAFFWMLSWSFGRLPALFASVTEAKVINQRQALPRLCAAIYDQDQSRDMSLWWHFHCSWGFSSNSTTVSSCSLNILMFLRYTASTLFQVQDINHWFR